MRLSQEWNVTQPTLMLNSPILLAYSQTLSSTHTEDSQIVPITSSLALFHGWHVFRNTFGANS